MKKVLGQLEGKVVLVTGGTGSFGNAFVRRILRDCNPKKVIIFSRDEWKQYHMQSQFADPRVRFFLGDIRDLARLQRAFDGVDVVVHAAALKQVPTLEYNPFEAVQTNIIGAENIITAAIDRNVPRVVALSTDKAVNPVNLYGATKLCMEKLFVSGNSYAGETHKTRFSLVRYGNVVGSRGSVIPLFLEKRQTGEIPITDKRMTRFWITLDQSVDLVLLALENMHGGEIFVPKIPSMKVTDLAKAVAPDCKVREIGIRPGEKIHEVLLTEDEAQRSLDLGECFIIQPSFFSAEDKTRGRANAKALPADFRYASDGNTEWMTEKELSVILKTYSLV